MKPRFSDTLAKSETDTLDNIAKDIANQTAGKISEAASAANTPSIRYKAQYLLEEVIHLLKAKV